MARIGRDGGKADLRIRRARGDELPAVISLLEAAMGWEPREPNEAFYRWKHLENAFGASPTWLACDGERVVGMRTFLRWEFLVDGSVVRAARAVDTATHPDYQGRGIFTDLTLAGLDELRAEGVALIFNTPNDKSRPGYIKMGWTQVGQLPTFMRLTNPLAAARLLRSRVPADKWSVASDAGAPAAAVFVDDIAVAALLATQPSPDGCATHRTPAYLRWRYGFAPLAYRAVTGAGGLRDGVVVFRLRRRGACTEAAVDEVLVPGADPGARRALLRAAIRVAGADYALVVDEHAPTRSWVRLPGGGPVLTTRPLDGSAPIPLARWRLTLGDVELF